MSFYPFSRCQNSLLISSHSSKAQVHTRQVRLAQPSFKVKPVGPLHDGTTNSGLCVGSVGTGCHALDASLGSRRRMLVQSRPARLRQWRSAGTEAAHTGVYSLRASVSRPCRHRPSLLFLNSRQMLRPGIVFCAFCGIVMVECIFWCHVLLGRRSPWAAGAVCFSSRAWTLAAFLLMIFFCRYPTSLTFYV